MSEELQTILDFVEGRIDGVQFRQSLYANAAAFEQFLSHDPDLPPYDYASQRVFLYLIQLDFDDFGDVLNAHGALSTYLARKSISFEATKKHSEYFDLMLTAQPGWVDAVDSDYFLQQVLPNAGERQGEELRRWVSNQLLERFKYISEPPNWIQNPEWPINENGPLVFFGEVEVKDYFHDDGCAYVSYDAKTGVCETIIQVS